MITFVYSNNPVSDNLAVSVISYISSLMGKLLGRIEVTFFSQKQICHFPKQGICIYVRHDFCMKNSWTNSYNVSFRLYPTI